MAAQRILIIGGSRGTGLLIARRLSQRGGTVTVMTRSPERTRALVGSAIQVVLGDITRPATLGPAIDDADQIVCTAGVRSGRPSSQSKIRATEYEGTTHILEAAAASGFRGRLLYMTASGARTPSIWATFLNIYKGNTLVWRRRAEDAIRASGIDYVVIRAGVLLNVAPKRHAIHISQDDLKLSPRYRVARADVADVFVEVLDRPSVSCVTFDVVWGAGLYREGWTTALDALKRDPPLNASTP
jgi:uncharacterized protein YbjT (DUF2867 family)